MKEREGEKKKREKRPPTGSFVCLTIRSLLPGRLRFGTEKKREKEERTI